MQTTETCATGVIRMPAVKLPEGGLPCIHNASFTKFQRLTNSQENLKSVNGAVIPLNMNSRVLENTRMIQCFAWPITTRIASGATKIAEDFQLVDGPLFTQNVNSTIFQQSTASQDLRNAPTGAMLNKTKLIHTNASKTMLTCATGVIEMPKAKLTEDGLPCIRDASSGKFQRLTTSQDGDNAPIGATKQLVLT